MNSWWRHGGWQLGAYLILGAIIASLMFPLKVVLILLWSGYGLLLISAYRPQPTLMTVLFLSLVGLVFLLPLPAGPFTTLTSLALSTWLRGMIVLTLFVGALRLVAKRD